MLSFYKKQKINKKTGFTLVELLVTITIFVILSGVVLINSNSFDSTVLLNNFSYDIALTIKQAQSYGVNVREDNSGNFSSSTGVYFNTKIDQSGYGSLMNFILFTDIDNDKIYKNQNVNVCVMGGIGNLECIQKYSMRNGTHIDSICAGKDDSTCDNNITALSIIFTRPSLAANIYIDNEPQQIPDNRKNYAKITLAASSGATTSVVVTSAGQIYVKK